MPALSVCAATGDGSVSERQAARTHIATRSEDRAKSFGMVAPLFGPDRLVRRSLGGGGIDQLGVPRSLCAKICHLCFKLLLIERDSFQVVAIHESVLLLSCAPRDEADTRGIWRRT